VRRDGERERSSFKDWTCVFLPMASSDNEILIVEDLLKQLEIEAHFPKLSDQQFKTFLAAVRKNISGDESAGEFPKYAFLFSGSMMEGAPFVRNLNPKQRRKYAECEFDMMFPMGTIIKGQEENVIQDLSYAKGFVWLKYKKDGVDIDLKNGKQVLDFLVEHKGDQYLNSTAFKTDSNLNTFPDLNFFNKFEEQLQGPSNNIDATLNLKAFAEGIKKTTKDDLNKAAKAVSTCLVFIQRAVVGLDNFHRLITKEFIELQKTLANGKVCVTQLDLDEFTCKVLPASRNAGEHINELIKLHWSMIAFVNEIIWAIEYLHRTVMVNELEKYIGPWKFAFLPLLAYPGTLQQPLCQFIMRLFSLPNTIREAEAEDMNTNVKRFLNDCFHKRPDELETVIKIFMRCLHVLGPRFHVLQAIVYDHKDDEEVNDSLNELNLNIDRVPALIAQEWPSIASEYKTRPRFWPNNSVIDNIFENSCHIVPKPSNGPERNEDLDWRWSFSQAEMLLANERTDQMNMVYLILKSLFYVYFKVFDHEEQSLPSYFAKTLFMWMCEQHPEKWWEEKSVAECVTILLEQLKSHFYDRSLPHYFICDLNLFENTPSELLDYGTAVAESICQDPLRSILDVTTQLVELQSSKSKKLNKTEKSRPNIFGREGTEEKIFEAASTIPVLIAEFRETIKKREENFKDIPEKQGVLRILRKLYEEEIPSVWPKEYEESLAIETDYNGDINITMTMNSLESELTVSNAIAVRFRGSNVTTLEMNHRV
jgi:Mab-21 protein.